MNRQQQQQQKQKNELFSRIKNIKNRMDALQPNITILKKIGIQTPTLTSLEKQFQEYKIKLRKLIDELKALIPPPTQSATPKGSAQPLKLSPSTATPKGSAQPLKLSPSTATPKGSAQPLKLSTSTASDMPTEEELEALIDDFDTPAAADPELSAFASAFPLQKAATESIGCNVPSHVGITSSRNPNNCYINVLFQLLFQMCDFKNRFISPFQPEFENPAIKEVKQILSRYQALYERQGYQNLILQDNELKEIKRQVYSVPEDSLKAEDPYTFFSVSNRNDLESQTNQIVNETIFNNAKSQDRFIFTLTYDTNTPTNIQELIRLPNNEIIFDPPPKLTQKYLLFYIPRLPNKPDVEPTPIIDIDRKLFKLKGIIVYLDSGTASGEGHYIYITYDDAGNVSFIYNNQIVIQHRPNIGSNPNAVHVEGIAQIPDDSIQIYTKLLQNKNNRPDNVLELDYKETIKKGGYIFLYEVETTPPTFALPISAATKAEIDHRSLNSSVFSRPSFIDNPESDNESFKGLGLRLGSNVSDSSASSESLLRLRPRLRPRLSAESLKLGSKSSVSGSLASGSSDSESESDLNPRSGLDIPAPEFVGLTPRSSDSGSESDLNPRSGLGIPAPELVGSRSRPSDSGSSDSGILPGSFRPRSSDSGSSDSGSSGPGSSDSGSSDSGSSDPGSSVSGSSGPGPGQLPITEQQFEFAIKIIRKLFDINQNEEIKEKTVNTNYEKLKKKIQNYTTNDPDNLLNIIYHAQFFFNLIPKTLLRKIKKYKDLDDNVKKILKDYYDSFAEDYKFLSFINSNIILKPSINGTRRQTADLLCNQTSELMGSIRANKTIPSQIPNLTKRNVTKRSIKKEKIQKTKEREKEAEDKVKAKQTKEQIEAAEKDIKELKMQQLLARIGELSQEITDLKAAIATPPAPPPGAGVAIPSTTQNIRTLTGKQGELEKLKKQLEKEKEPDKKGGKNTRKANNKIKTQNKNNKKKTRRSSK